MIRLAQSFLPHLPNIQPEPDPIRAPNFSETDFRDDVKKITVPTLILHGGDDQIAPIEISGNLTTKIVKNAKLVVYEGAPHGLLATHKDKVNADLLAFLKS